LLSLSKYMASKMASPVVDKSRNHHVIPTKVGISDTTGKTKNEMPAFASMTMEKCLSPKKGHNDTTIHVIPALSRNHVINHQNPPPTPHFGKLRGEKDTIQTSMSFPRKWESPTKPGKTKNEMPAFASMTVKKCLSPMKGHNDTTIHVIPALSRNLRHNSMFFHPSLKRVARFIGSGDDQKSGNPAYYSVPPLQGGIIVLLDAVTDISPRRGAWLPFESPSTGSGTKSGL